VPGPECSALLHQVKKRATSPNERANAGQTGKSPDDVLVAPLGVGEGEAGLGETWHAAQYEAPCSKNVSIQVCLPAGDSALISRFMGELRRPAVPRPGASGRGAGVSSVAFAYAVAA
jgi:hypothetical protein